MFIVIESLTSSTLGINNNKYLVTKIGNYYVTLNVMKI
jgi:hypothetical protein